MYYKELALPPYPLANFDKFKEQKTEYTYSNSDIDLFLNADLLSLLKSIGLRPVFFAWFGFVNKQQGISTIHSDVGYINNSWKSIPFGINWEVTPGDSTFYWWDTHGDKQIWPGPSSKPKDIFGIHHGSVMNRDSSNYSCLDSFKPKVGIPFLARTDVPHQVTYSTPSETRVAISIRFDINELPDWDSALKKFEPFFL